MNFSSDNASPVHPDVMAAIEKANQGFANSYGTDTAMDNVRQLVRDVFEAPDAAVYLVATGTTANVLSLASYVQPWQSIFCHREAHIQMDECGAPEFYTGGAKLVLVDGADGKIEPQSLETAIQSTIQGFVHSVQRGAVSLTNVTELGAVYSIQEIAELTAIAKKYGLPVHMDGARFANAVVSQNCSPAELTWKSGIDVLSFGGTKNGLMGVEAVVLFDSEKAWEFELRRKRGGHLFSKHRFLSAQMEAYLTDELWLRLANDANAAGQHLSQGIRKITGSQIIHPTHANMVFAAWKRGAHKNALSAGATYYPWPLDQTFEGADDETVSARLVCSWCTTPDEITALLEVIAKG